MPAKLWLLVIIDTTCAHNLYMATHQNPMPRDYKYTYSIKMGLKTRILFKLQFFINPFHLDFSSSIKLRYSLDFQAWGSSPISLVS